MIRWFTNTRGAAAGLLLAALVSGGCQTLHEVKVDAINDPSRPMGTSYRLELRDPAGGVDKDLGAEAARDIRDALAARGLFEAPPNTRPDMVIDAEYGVGPGQMKIVYQARGGAAMMGPIITTGTEAKPILVFEKYIKLSARESTPEDVRPSRSRRERGEEIWSIQVSIEDPRNELAPYLAVLASTSIGFIGTNTGAEKHIEVDAAIARATLRRQPGSN